MIILEGSTSRYDMNIESIIVSGKSSETLITLILEFNIRGFNMNMRGSNKLIGRS